MVVSEPVLDDLPQDLSLHIKNYLPKSADYIKNCLLFSGYQTIDAVIKLESEEEVKRMFDFVVKIKDVVEDQEKMFGIFASKPENIVIIPGLKPVFAKLIQVAKDLKSPGKKKASLKPKTHSFLKAKTQKKAAPLPF